ncbi:ABC transporter permease [Pelagibius marinus]|uniref:ABC transporter permease n=1 Tax=Pelagibius marinus TaxID=2762760 RepID=UPI0029CA5C73|nr:iron ABC transporter permease [Pelagibius marinus]
MAESPPLSPSIDPAGPFDQRPGRPLRRGRGKLRRPWAPLTWLSIAVAGLFLVPVVSVLFSLTQSGDGTWSHLASTVLPRYLFNTAVLVGGVGIGVPLLGAGTAWLVTMCRFPGRRVFEWALILPLAVPAYVMAYAYTDFLQPAGPVQTLLRDLTGLSYREYWFPEVRSLGGAVAMLTLVLYPYAYMLSRAAFLDQSVCALDVSRTLGCGPWATFFRVALPLARPAIIAGTALALMETLADFGTVSFFGVPNFTTGIVRAWISFGDRTTAGQLSSILLIFVFLVLLLEVQSRGRARFHHATDRYQQLPGHRLKGLSALGAFLACLLPLCFGFLLPAGILLTMALAAGDQQFGKRYLELVGNSVTLAVVTAILAVGLATLMAYGRRLQGGPLVQAANRLAAMGYAIPGTIIAVGVLVPFAAFDNTLDGWLRATFGISSGLLLTGSIAALVFAYLVRFLAVSLNTVESGLGKIRPSMDDAARALGVRPLSTLARVHAPMMWPSLLTAGLVVFVDVMKELPATLVMRPFNFDTLAVQAHNFAADERLTEAATPALTIVAVGIPPVILLSRAIARGRPGRKAPPRSAGALKK